ncbi:GTPase Era [Anthocerotibacter panamensis]|uniref:GTPase Era n=1 Tax=Anthocerotibacter panamensis TaxID=2857077 RepID=UPI001C401657|nr:GTPase Era [Anthocerotibacter panamensis]
MNLIPQAPPDFRSGFVALIGRPNVGKSTLLNRVLGEKIAITSPVAQTTRHSIRGILTRPTSQIIFIDTPGIHKPRHQLGETLVMTARSAMAQVDVVVFVADASTECGAGDRLIATTLIPNTMLPVLLLNKIDLAADRQEASYQALWSVPTPMFKVSAQTGEGIEHFLKGLEALLPSGPYYYPPDSLTDQTERVLCAELIREQILHQTTEEVPHAVAVVIEAMEEQPRITRIRAVIYVERDSQKGILIGKGGQRLKEINTHARLAMEEMLQTKVYLEVFVKVENRWRQNPRTVKALYPQ